jgi:WD40 repeat protein
MTNASDRLLVEWLTEGPDNGPRPALERALAATRRTPQRPGWTFVQRWIPMELAMRRALVPRPLILILLAALVALVLAGVILSVGSPHRLPPAFGPAANGAILVDVDGQLISMRQDGSDARPIPIGLGLVHSPAFSPDGTKIAFLTGPEQRKPQSLFLANADGSGARNVTGGLQIVANPIDEISWSPDGQSVAFGSIADGRWKVFVVGIDGTNLRAIGGDENDREFPAWSPDGAWIAYRIMTGTDTRLAIARPDGTNERVLVAGDRAPASLAGPKWAPVGSTIAFSVTRDSHDRVGIVGPDTRVRLVSDPDVFGAAWSPDGRSLLATTLSNGGLILDVESWTVRTTIPRGLIDCAAMWSPDGTSILGWGRDCRELWRFPVADPAAATRVVVPDGLINVAGWQRLAP